MNEKIFPFSLTKAEDIGKSKVDLGKQYGKLGDMMKLSIIQGYSEGFEVYDLD